MRPILLAPIVLLAWGAATACGADQTPPPAPAPAPSPATPHPRVLLGITAKESEGSSKDLAIFPPATVDSVAAGSNAERLGIKVGDTITSLNGHPVANMGDLVQALHQASPGDAATVVVTRNGTSLTLTGVFQASAPAAPSAKGDDGAIMP